MAPARTANRGEAALYRRNASRLTTAEVLHSTEKEAAIAALPALKRRKMRVDLEQQWAAVEAGARAEAAVVVSQLRTSAADLVSALEELAATNTPELLGKAETAIAKVRSGIAQLDEADEFLAQGDFGAAGSAVEHAEHELGLIGGQLIVSMNRALAQAAVSKTFRARLEENVAESRQAKLQLDRARAENVSRAAIADAAIRLRQLQAQGFRLAAELLSSQVRRESTRGDTSKVGRDNQLRVVSPHECETFADVGGLAHVKQQLRDSIGAILERPDEAARYQVVYNGVLFYGPPGTGKNLLSRAIAGEYGLRYIRFSPAAIASSYMHEAAANLRHLFELARANVPCLLYLDEIDTIAADRGDQPSADHREVVTQLMVCLEEYRGVPGLVVAAASNDIDRLDPALREGRFDAKIHVPLPDPADRAEVLDVHLRRRGETVAWDTIKLPELARITHGYNAAALETIVSLAAQRALKTAAPLDQATLETVVRERGGQHRLSLEESVGWDDIVLPKSVRDQVMEILTVFSNPDLALDVGVRPPAGILLYGPPGTGKTTIAKAIASQVQASFYEMSAADLLSKWAGESEQRVAKLFTKARSNRPSIIFIDEIDALLRRRQADSTNKWEERVLSQFLRELDGLKGGEGVLLVGATNRVDAIDEAIVGRRLSPIEVGLPDYNGRLKLLQLLCQHVKLGRGVDLKTLSTATDGMSGADLRRLRDAAGMKALNRTARSGTRPKSGISISMTDFESALEAQRSSATLAMV
jgi:transitional endoplasmic reticulum ATPase